MPVWRENNGNADAADEKVTATSTQANRLSAFAWAIDTVDIFIL